MAALPAGPTAPADTGAAATGQGREQVGFGSAAPRDREPEHAWLPGLLGAWPRWRSASPGGGETADQRPIASSAPAGHEPFLDE